MEDILEMEEIKNKIDEDILEMEDNIVDDIENHKELLSMYNNIILKNYIDRQCSDNKYKNITINNDIDIDNDINNNIENDIDDEIFNHLYKNTNIDSTFLELKMVIDTNNLIYDEVCSHSIGIEQVKDEIELVKNQIVDLHSDVEIIKNKIDEILSIITSKY